MRQKKEAVLCFASNDDGLPKVVRDYRARYRTISQVLDKNSEILDVVHEDLKHLSQGGGRGGKATSPRRTSCGPSSSSTSKGYPFARRSYASAVTSSCKTSCGCGRRR